VLKKKVGYTGGRFRSYVLWGVSHNHPQVVPGPPRRVGRKGEDGVLTARFLCATPVKRVFVVVVVEVSAKFCKRCELE